MKYLNDCKTLEELKAAYRRLAKKLHPDHGGSTEAMTKALKSMGYDAMDYCQMD